MDSARLTLILLLFSTIGFSQIYSGVPAEEGQKVYLKDDGLDAFGRLPISEAQSLFDGQFTYDLQPLLFDTLLTANSDIKYNTTERFAELILTAAGSDTATIQSFQWFRYQPGKSQKIFITFNMKGGAANVEKMIGYTDGQTNGYEFLMNGTTPTFRIRTTTGVGNVTIPQESWNLDRLDGTDVSGITLDLTKTQILVIDFQALYVGRIRFGFSIDGLVYWAHEVDNANTAEFPYIANANLPLRASIISTGSGITDTMDLICSSVLSEAGQEENYAYGFTASASVTAGNGTDTHVISIQPKTTFNGVPNTATYIIDRIAILNEGTSDVIYKVVLGQAITTPTTADANTTYSGMEVSTGGTLSGSPAIVFDQAYATGGTNQISGLSAVREYQLKYPITLDARGNQRDLGKVTILAQGIGGTSDVEVSVFWREIR